MDWLQAIYESLSEFFYGVLSVLSYIWSIFQSLWYGMTTLLTGVYDVIHEIFSTSLFQTLFDIFDTLSGFIGGPATVLMSTLLFIIMLRIGIAFIFNLLKLNIGYHTLQKQINRWSIEDMKKNSKLS